MFQSHSHFSSSSRVPISLANATRRKVRFCSAAISTRHDSRRTTRGYSFEGASTETVYLRRTVRRYQMLLALVNGRGASFLLADHIASFATETGGQGHGWTVTPRTAQKRLAARSTRESIKSAKTCQSHSGCLIIAVGSGMLLVPRNYCAAPTPEH